MAFPRVNMASFWSFFIGCVIMSVSFFIPGGAAQAGWTSYSRLATIIPTDGQTYWLIGMILLSICSQRYIRVSSCVNITSLFPLAHGKIALLFPAALSCIDLLLHGAV